MYSRKEAIRMAQEVADRTGQEQHVLRLADDAWLPGPANEGSTTRVRVLPAHHVSKAIVKEILRKLAGF